jgi:cytochrome c oxidase assembly factor CtaG/polyferredoxin
VDSLGAAALTSWNLDPLAIALLLLIALIYIRGWLRIRQRVLGEYDKERLAAFLAGLALLLIATESPLDTFDHFFLAAHMTQHLLLMMFAPPLILIGHPTLPLLRGLPKPFVKEGLGPFMTWPPLRRAFQFLVAPLVAWSLFAASTVFWHLPWPYEAGLRTPWIHGLQHASFFWTGILFWWPIIRPVPGKSRWPEWVLIPYLLASDLVNTGISIIFVFSGRVLYPSYEAIHASSVRALDDQTLAGLIMWVPGSVVYLIPAFVIAMRLLAGPKLRKQREKMKRVPARMPTSRVRSSVVLPNLRRAAQVAMLLLAIAVMADGFFGRQIAPMNLAGVLPWIHWRFLVIAALLAVGNLFCMTCPFTLARDVARKILPARLRWPSALRTKWLASALLLLYLCAYEVFGLWDSPWLTAWIIAGYFLAALIIDGIFRGASFCKYVCPIGQFNFISSLVSPREVRVKRQEVCKSCQTYDCIRGNERARGCELYLFQPKKASNLDCTFCLDCVKACPHDNVSLLPVSPAATILKDPYRSSIGRLSHRTDLAALALLIVFGAFTNAAMMTSPVMMWEHRLHARLGAGAMPWIVAGSIIAGAALLPFVMSLILRLVTSREIVNRFAFTLVPIGIAMWFAHICFHFFTSWSPTASLAGSLNSLQILILDAGLLMTLYVGWLLATQYKERWSVFGGLCTVACALYAAGIWILLQPMQMRGMM